jgi:hypothetical protein
MSNFLIKILLAEYVIIMVVCLFEKNWPRATYWLGAIILNYSLLLMK